MAAESVAEVPAMRRELLRWIRSFKSGAPGLYRERVAAEVESILARICEARESRDAIESDAFPYGWSQSDHIRDAYLSGYADSSPS
jgi:hypothetical protein